MGLRYGVIKKIVIDGKEFPVYRSPWWKRLWMRMRGLVPSSVIVEHRYTHRSSTSTPPEDSAPRGGGESGNGLGGGGHD